jgi:hypothetical protein
MHTNMNMTDTTMTVLDGDIWATWILPGQGEHIYFLHPPASGTIIELGDDGRYHIRSPEEIAGEIREAYHAAGREAVAREYGIDLRDFDFWSPEEIAGEIRAAYRAAGREAAEPVAREYGVDLRGFDFGPPPKPPAPADLSPEEWL